MRSDQNSLATFQLRGNIFLVERDNSLQSCCQALGKLFWEDMTSVTRVVGRVMRVGSIHYRRRDVIASAPDQDLIFSVLVDSFLFIESLKSTVMAFIQFPVFRDRDPHEIRLLQNMPQGSDCTLQERGKRNVCRQSFLLDKLPSFDDFFVALWGERAVIPACELVFQIPSGFTVAN